jgi:outer membrane protein TolC
MMRTFALPLTLLALVVSPLGAQLSDSALNEVIREAEATPTAENHVQAAQAARLMRDYDAAEAHLDDAWNALGPIFNGMVNEHLYLALASGEGVRGLQRAFRQLGQTFAFSPIQISNWAGNYPEILADARSSHNLVRKGYQQGEFGYLELLTAQRTYFRANLAYLKGLSELWTSSVQIEGLLLTGGLESPGQ